MTDFEGIGIEMQHPRQQDASDKKNLSEKLSFAIRGQEAVTTDLKLVFLSDAGSTNDATQFQPSRFYGIVKLLGFFNFVFIAFDKAYRNE